MMSVTKEKRVSEQIVEFLLTEISRYSLDLCTQTTAERPSQLDEESALTVTAEMAAAKLERMGAAVGYRLTERLAEVRENPNVFTFCHLLFDLSQFSYILVGPPDKKI